MDWKKIIINLPTEKVDEVYEQLVMNGIEDVEINSDEYLKLDVSEQNWDYYDNEEKLGTSIIIYRRLNDFNEVKEIIETIIEKMSQEDFEINLLIETINEKDWNEEWKKYFKPKKVTEKIVIKPEWEEYEKSNQDEIVIEIDPGMAFGTGTHGTTSMCMELLEKYISDENNSVLDVGCGSGILSIAAKLLGASEVTGIDIEEIAITTSYDNAAKNNISDIEFLQGDLTKNVDVKADIVVANIIADIIIILLNDVKENLKGNKIFIASGIIIDKEDEVIEAIKDAGFEILDIKYKDEWVAVASKLKE